MPTSFEQATVYLALAKKQAEGGKVPEGVAGYLER